MAVRAVKRARRGSKSGPDLQMICPGLVHEARATTYCNVSTVMPMHNCLKKCTKIQSFNCILDKYLEVEHNAIGIVSV